MRYTVYQIVSKGDLRLKKQLNFIAKTFAWSSSSLYI